MFSGIWRLIWDKVDDIGVHAIGVSWIKGHASKPHVLEGVLNEWQRESKIIANTYAKAQQCTRRWIRNCDS